MDTKKIIDDLLLVVQNLNVGNTTIFRIREKERWIEYEIHSPENIPVITMRYSIDPSENNVKTRRWNEGLIDKNKALLENVFSESVNENSSISRFTKHKFNKIFPIQYKEEDSRQQKINIRATDEMKNVSNAGEGLEETSKSQIDPEVHSETTHCNGDSVIHDAVVGVICETTIKNEENHNGIDKYIIDKKQFKCSFCEKVYKKKNQRNIHERIHTRERPYTCAECNKSFSILSCLNEHRKIHTNERSFTCNQCGKSFKQWSHLKQHTTSIHSFDRPFPCELCEKSFKKKFLLKQHMWIHTDEKPYNCKQCNKSFRQKSHLTNHIRLHTGEKPYNCEHCNKSFRLKTSFTYHIRLHTGEKPYICDYCGESFVSTSHRFYHEKTSHQGKI